METQKYILALAMIMGFGNIGKVYVADEGPNFIFYLSDDQVKEDTTLFLTGPDTQTSYTFTVKAINEIGNVSPASNPVFLNIESGNNPDELIDNGDFELGYNKIWTHKVIDVTHISPTNEPDYEVSYESMNTTPEELTSILKNLKQRLKSESLDDIKIISPECFRVAPSSLTSTKSTTYYINSIFIDPLAKEAVDVVGTHTYADKDNTANWGGLRDAGSGKPVWVTESSTLDDPDKTMTNAKILIKWIINGFNEGGLTAYLYHLFYSTGDAGLITYSDNDGVIMSKRYYAFKQFVNFVRPGFKRLDADISAGRTNIKGSAFLSPDGQKIVLEILNEGPGCTLPINLPENVTSVQHLITSDAITDNCTLIDDVGFKPGDISINPTLPALSFHTIVLNIKGNTSSPEYHEAVSRDKSFIVYPNPSADIITVRFSGLRTESILSIQNLNGVKVREFNLLKGTENVNLNISGLAKGIYILSLSSDKKSNYKIIKQ
ncbi:MAG: T9SS type A sorting domain-containing protein [Bacteroidia bacterium]|nr:T9SS type A sorting domain-containing protein [Bacteroidia bacterium]